MAYIELEDLRSYLGIEPTETADDDLLEGAIEAAQSYINSQTNRRFEAHTETRHYQREARNDQDRTRLDLDADLISITTLTNGDTAGTVITAANYWLMPRNDGPPYHQIKLYSDTGVYWEWDPDIWVAVLGEWGYSQDPPADIREACLQIAAYAYKKKDSQVFDTTAVPEAGVIVIPAGIPASARMIIERYKRYIR
jgi:hypothetical protein